jgi:hypothetical protein
MRSLFVGDVHGCADSLRRLLDAAHADRVILLGDIFAKGPDPRGVWDIVRDIRPEAVLGNHDERLLQRWEGPEDTVHFRAALQLPDEARAWLEGLPLFLHGDGWLAVHAGVHPFEGERGTTRRQALVLRRWPDDADPEHPFWWQLYERSTRVFYGHDALRGVQHHRRTVGLDSGAVYGGALSGFILEEGRVLQTEGWR